MLLFWCFWIYSFLGYGLEKAFARVTHARKQVRKAFLFSPLCPAYGLGMTTALLLGAGEAEQIWEQMLVGASAATAVEYALHWGYEKFFGVRFWDYDALHFTLGGRVSLPFSLLWGVLSLVAFRFVQPVIESFSAAVPLAAANALLLAFTVDALYSARILLLSHDTERLALGNLRAALRT